MSDEGQRKKSGEAIVTVAAVIIAIGLLVALRPFFGPRPKIYVTPVDERVRNNLRMLSQGAEQIFIEQGVSSVTSAALVGTNSTQYVKTFATVANETYTATILQGHPITASGISGARTVTYAP